MQTNYLKKQKHNKLLSVLFIIVAFLFIFTYKNVLALSMPTAGHYHPKDIYDWSLEKYPDQKNNISTVELKDRVYLEGEGIHSKDSQGEVMAIMIANQTTSGAPAQGGDDYRFGYAFSHWQYVDTLVYWGGSAGEGIIVVPSADFVDSAHKNGVKVVGTVFFPPIAYGGKEEWVKDFVAKDENGNFILVDKMIEIADTLGFDGWFINQETNVNETIAKDLKDFMKEYNTKTEKTLVWYDSMISSGAVSWQGSLNALNYDYLIDNGEIVSDEFFVDFRWYPGSINRSINQANSIGFNPLKAYFGFDVQGQGNFNSNLTSNGYLFEALMDENNSPKVSLGLYVPDSAMRNHTNKEGQDFWTSVWQDEANLWVNSQAKLGEKSNLSWPGISNHFREKTPITSLPFNTNFNLGAGENFYIDGQIQKEGTFLNRSTQDIMPTYRWLYENFDGNNLIPNLDTQTVYYGGTSLKLEGDFVEGGTTKNILYGSDITIENNMTANIVKKGDAKVDLLLINEYDEEFIISGDITNDEWDSITYDLSELQGQKIKKFGVLVTSTQNINSKINIGKLSISSSSNDININSFEVESEEIDSGISAKINFLIDTDTNSMVNIYYDNSGQRKLLGTTNNGRFYVENVTRPDDSSLVKFVAIPVNNDNEVLYDKAKDLEFNFGQLEAPEADFTYDKSFIQVGEELTLTQNSSISTSEVEWFIPGASIERSNEETITVSFDKPGVYTITLTARNSSGEDVATKENVITVYDDGYEITNLALFDGVNVNVSDSCNLYTEGPNKANDGLNNTKWCDNSNDNPWLIYELNEESTITGFEILHASEGGEDRNFNTKDFDISISLDGENWEKIIEVRNNKDGFTKHPSFDRAKFVKLDILSGEQGGRVARIYEFRVLGFTQKVESVVENQEEISNLRYIYSSTILDEDKRQNANEDDLAIYDELRQKAYEILNSNQFNIDIDSTLADELFEIYTKIINYKEPQIEVVTEIREEEIEFETKEVLTDKLLKGESQISQEGENGLVEITEEITYEDGVEIGRKEISRQIVKEPLDKIIEIGTSVAINITPNEEESIKEDEETSIEDDNSVVEDDNVASEDSNISTEESIFETQKENDSQNSTTDTNNSENPTTGDDFKVSVYLGVLILAIIAVVIIVFVKRK